MNTYQPNNYNTMSDMHKLEDIYIDAIRVYNEQLEKHGRPPITEDELPGYLIKHSLKRLLTWLHIANPDQVYHAKLCVMSTRGCVYPIWVNDMLDGLIVTEPHGRALKRITSPDKRPHFTVFFDKRIDGCHMCYYVLPYNSTEYMTIRKGRQYVHANDVVHKYYDPLVDYDHRIDRLVFEWLKSSFGSTDDSASHKIRTLLTKYMKLMKGAGFIPNDVLVKYGSIDSLIDMCVTRILASRIKALTEMCQ